VIITRASNNFGPYQYPEKLIPLFATNAIEGKKLPLYGDGRQVRDWLYVEDHCRAIELLLEKGTPGEAYNIAADHEHENVETVGIILDELGKPESLIEHVKDREGHDRRYSLDWSKLRSLGWEPRVGYEGGVRATVRWYVEHEAWWRRLKDGEFMEYYRRQYAHRSPNLGV